MDNIDVEESSSRKRPPGNAGRCVKDAAKRKYPKKRVHWRKKRAANDDQNLTPEKKLDTPVSVKKVKQIKKVNKSKCEGYRLVDMEIMQAIISQLCCPECYENKLILEEDDYKKKGLSSSLCIKCDCGYVSSFYTSKVVDRKNEVSKGGMKAYEVNYRAVYASRTVGIDHTGLETICGILNMPKPMTATNYNNISFVFRDAAKEVAENSMKTAADQLRINKESDVIDIGVSVDGSWQRRGFSSLNGVVAAISIDNGKVIDVEPLSRYCRECAVNSRKIKDEKTLKLWKETHIEQNGCKINHVGSAPSMETEGVIRIFQRSIEKRRGRYLSYYGDGDSKAFSSVENIYDDVTVVKYECVGHYQKRVGCRLRALKKRVKGLKPLTEAMIDKLQNYFGIALRANCTTVEDMSKGIMASYFHVCSSSKRELHNFCPTGSNSWCQFKRDLTNGTNLYKPGPGLSDEVIKHVKPIYLDLVNPKELQKCLHGKTQNQNESFNSLIWQRAPKHRYCGFDKLELAVYDSVTHFNDGRQAMLDILKSVHIIPGPYTVNACILSNMKRKRSASYHDLSSSKITRKRIRGEKKSKSDKNKSKEGKTYKPGAF